MKIPLVAGAYESRSLAANGQRCLNLYVEKNPEGAAFPTTHYPTPGSRIVLTTSSAGWRCLYVASDGRLFGVSGAAVYLINADFTTQLLGTLRSQGTPVYMIDNRNQVLIVDGTEAGYTITLEDLSFAQVNNEAFYGSTRLAYVDGYIILNRPGTNQFYISLLSEIAFDALDFASKTGSSDALVCIGVTRRNIFLFGENTTEVWSNSGGSDFTLSRIQGTFIQFGCQAPHSLCESDGSLYWVSRSPQGHCLVLRTMNYDRERISTFAIEQELQSYERIDDAIGYIHQMGGHYWYVLNFPTADRTWVYDIASSQWHELGFHFSDGSNGRHRGNCFAFWNGMHLVGDWENGNLYELSLDLYTDAGTPIQRLRTFPHLVDDGNRVAYRSFEADMEAGNPTALEPSSAPEIRLRWSDSKGMAWSQSVRSTVGFRGQYNAVARWFRLGQARDRVFELSWSADGKICLNGAYVEAQPGVR